MTCGFSAGANPIKDEIYFPERLGSFSDVAVLPPTRKPGKYALLPVPSETTASSKDFIVSEVAFDITFDVVS